LNKQKVWFWIVSGVVLLIIGLLVGWSGISGRLPWQSGGLYEDPQGRFTMEVGPSWERVETGGSFAQFKIRNPAMNMYLLVLEAGTVEDAFSEAFNVLGFDAGLLSGGRFANFDDWLAYTKVDAAEIDHGLVGQIVEETPLS